MLREAWPKTLEKKLNRVLKWSILGPQGLGLVGSGLQSPLDPHLLIPCTTGSVDIQPVPSLKTFKTRNLGETTSLLISTAQK